jgi:hypothetical protein
MDSRVAAALIAAGVALLVALLTNLVTARTTRRQVLQTQLAEIVKKRAEVYPGLWRIHIKYETHWQDEGRAKTREWAEEYLTALNSFNLKGGVFFSESLYRRFVELREKLYLAVKQTAAGEAVEEEQAATIRLIVYGGDSYGSGLSAIEKDDLGSYQTGALERRGRFNLAVDPRLSATPPYAVRSPR